MTTPVQTLAPVEFDAPLVNPTPGGLYPAVSWVDQIGPSRFLADGVRVRVHNYGGETAFGVWGAPWCGDPGDDDLKFGTRPGSLDPFDPITVWAFDQCDPTEPSRAEIRQRAEQNLRLLEPVAVEREFAARLLADATIVDPSGILAAVGYLEGRIAQTNTRAQIHCSPEHAPFLVDAGLVVTSGGQLRTPLGNLWVFGGGYVDGLGRTIVATSPVFGWRDQVEIREAIDPNHSTAIAVAERSLVVGYESCIAAARLV